GDLVRTAPGGRDPGLGEVALPDLLGRVLREDVLGDDPDEVEAADPEGVADAGGVELDPAVEVVDGLQAADGLGRAGFVVLAAGDEGQEFLGVAVLLFGLAVVEQGKGEVDVFGGDLLAIAPPGLVAELIRGGAAVGGDRPAPGEPGLGGDLVLGRQGQG